LHLELVELLRCPVVHEVSVLVAVAERVQSRFIMQGWLGCPVCGAEYPIIDGVTHFVAPSVGEAVSHNIENDGNVMALAAQLQLSEGRSTFALVGYNIVTGLALRDIVPARLFIVNPPDISYAPNMSAHAIAIAPLGIISAAALPLVDAKLDGLAVTGWPSSITALYDASSAARALRVRGRLVLPVSAELSPPMRELARDTNVLVAEREPEASPPISIRRRTDN
jgi:uncharacterized protein YbaR (Trm112 family)